MASGDGDLAVVLEGVFLWLDEAALAAEISPIRCGPSATN
jgi:hypothetical protein